MVSRSISRPSERWPIVLPMRAPAAQRAGSLNWGETVAGCRVVLSTDGGRIRIRTNNRVPKTAKGRNRYRTDSREPKLLIIYVVDEVGHMNRDFLAVIDGTLGGPDAIFKLMEFYLRELNIATADKILLSPIERVGFGTGSRHCYNGWRSNRNKQTSWWTSIMRWSIWGRSRPCSTAGRWRTVRRGSVANGDAC